MKKLFFAPVALLGIFCISCSNNSGGLSDTAKKNLEANHAIQKMFETKDFSKIGDYIAQDGVDHSGPTGDVKGVANIKAEIEKMAAMTSDDKSEIIKELADDEYVMSYARYTGTCKMAGMGYKVGDKVDMSTIELSKFKDGKATEHWSFASMADMMKMMGTPPPPMPMHVDSM
jgi:predicted ester cyclase